MDELFMDLIERQAEQDLQEYEFWLSEQQFNNN